MKESDKGYQLPVTEGIQVESDGKSGPYQIRCETDGVDIFRSRDDGIPAAIGAKLAMIHHIKSSGHPNHYFKKTVI